MVAHRGSVVCKFHFNLSRLESKFDIFLVIFVLYRRKLKKESHRAIMWSNPHLSIYRRERVETFTVIL